MFHPILAEPHLSAATVLMPLVDMLVDRLGCTARIEGAAGDCRATLDLAGRGLIIVSAVDREPSAEVCAAARHALTGSSVPAAVVIFYPDDTSRWRSSPKAYVAWRYASDVAGVELMGARIAFDEGAGVVIMDQTGEGLVAAGGGHFYATCAFSEPHERWQALLAGASAWQDRVVRRIWQEAA